MIQRVFRHAIYAPTPKVLTKQLKPLSCGHVFILQASQSPYYYGGQKNLNDLVFAVQISSMTFEDAQAAFDVDHVAGARQWKRDCKKLDFAKEAAIFETYWADHVVFPEREIQNNQRRSLHPWALLVAVKLMPLVGESRAWNMPLPMALSLSSALGELNGDDSVISEENWELIDRAKRYRQEMKVS